MVFFGLTLVMMASATEAFRTPFDPKRPAILSGIQRTAASSVVSLAANKAKNGLAFLVQEGGDLVPSRLPRNLGTKKKKASSKNSGSSSSSIGVDRVQTISPDLLSFMDQKKLDDNADTATIENGASTLDLQQPSGTDVFTPFATKTKPVPSVSSSSIKKSKPGAQQQNQNVDPATIGRIVTQVTETMERGGSTMVSTLLPLLEQLALLPERQSNANVLTNASLKQLLAPTTTKKGQPQRLDYRLAWVGSDAAVSHTGTGLHKVALARLQEVFLSFTGRNRIQYTEVIRILGPFPNVKNTLQGSGTVHANASSSPSSSLSFKTGSAKESAASRDNINNSDNANWKIVWDSMIDGTGKELLAGRVENSQTVWLNVCYCDGQVLLATLPGKTIVDDQGQHVLLFLREANMDEKLEALRVA